MKKKKSNTLKPLNPYEISWLLITPEKGKMTKRDIHSLNKIKEKGKKYGRNFMPIDLKETVVGSHFSNKKSASSFIKLIKNKLNKNHKVFIITDKQFGMIKHDFSNNESKLFITKKQLKATKIVK